MKLTSEEKTVLITIVIAAFIGVVINFLFSYQNKIQIQDYATSVLLININTAQVEDFDKLPGIGKVLAQRMINSREKNGKFGSIEELKKIKGITSKKFESIKQYLTVTKE